MDGNLERRVFRLKGELVAIRQLIATMQGQIAALQQQLYATQGPGGGGGGSDVFYVAFPTGSVSGATWTAGVPVTGASFTAHVYRVSGTSTVTDLGTQTCVNWLAGSLVANKGVTVFPDGAGNYCTASQSCT